MRPISSGSWRKSITRGRVADGTASTEALELLENDEIETLPGQTLFHLTGQLKGEKTFEITDGLIGPEIMDVELWIAPDTFELHRLILIENLEDPESERSWQMDFWDFDLDVEIIPPQ